MLDKIKQELSKRNNLLSLPKKEELKIKKEMGSDLISDLISDKLVKLIKESISNNP